MPSSPSSLDASFCSGVHILFPDVIASSFGTGLFLYIGALFFSAIAPFFSTNVPSFNADALSFGIFLSIYTPSLASSLLLSTLFISFCVLQLALI